MGYLNPLLFKGFETFARDAADAGVGRRDRRRLPARGSRSAGRRAGGQRHLLIRLATPTTDDARLPAVVRRTSGFIYYVSVAGVTGVLEADADAVAPAVARLRAASGLPVAVGFGIKTPERAAAVARVADGRGRRLGPGGRNRVRGQGERKRDREGSSQGVGAG
jgi:tryptophan synthase alpha chain